VRAVCAVFAVCAGAWCAVACHVVGCTHDHPVQPTHTHRTPATLLPHTHTHTHVATTTTGAAGVHFRRPCARQPQKGQGVRQGVPPPPHRAHGQRGGCESLQQGLQVCVRAHVWCRAVCRAVLVAGGALCACAALWLLHLAVCVSAARRRPVRHAAHTTRRVYFHKTSDSDTDYLVDHSIIMYLIDPAGDFVTFYGASRRGGGAWVPTRTAAAPPCQPATDQAGRTTHRFQEGTGRTMLPPLLPPLLPPPLTPQARTSRPSSWPTASGST
jgi:hypothetical protein